MNLRALIGKLNVASRESLEAAAVLCLSRTHYGVEIEHWLLKLLDSNGTEFDLILRSGQVDKMRLHRDLSRALDSLKTGNPRNPTLSPSLVHLIREAWVAATIEFGHSEIRTGDLLFALISDAGLSKQLKDITPQLGTIETEDLANRLPDLAAQSSEHTGESRRADVMSAPPRADDFAFVSYHRGDQEFVFWLAQELRKNQVDLWVDQWAINPGDDWDREIETAIDRCRQFIIVLSPESCASREVSGELRAALIGSKQIIPILRKPCRPPRQLLTIQHLDFTGADYRQETPLRQLAQLLAIKKAKEAAQGG